MRPQLASSPKKAVLTRGELATVKATSRALAASAAPVTRISISLVAPSPSMTNWRAKSSRTACRASPKRRPSRLSGSVIGSFPAVPPAITRRVSLVLVSPSMVMALKDVAVAAFSRDCRTGRAMTASVATKPSMVAILGAIIPAPLAMPPMVTNLSPSSTRVLASFGTVSVVMMARAASAQPSARSTATSSGSACARKPTASCMPITPVEATRTFSGVVLSA